MEAFRALLLYDDELRAAANARGANYWPVYYQEILRRIGLPFEVIGPEQLDGEALRDATVVLLPPLEDGSLDDVRVGRLRDWVRGGGLLVGFATEGLDDLFGITVERTLGPLGDEFTPSACIRLCDPEWTAELLPPYERDTALPVIAPSMLISAPDCRELARLLSAFERDLKRPAVTYRSLGAGAACWWAFDLAQCLWKMQQGQPVYEDFDGDGYLRTMDQVTTRPWSGDVPYADLMGFALRRIIAEHGGVFLHELPPRPDGAVPDAIFHWGGDDEGATDVQVPAAEFMADNDLPYHINVMPYPPERHPLPVDDFDRLKQLGCETSIHFNFIDGVEHPYAFTKEDLADQLNAYRAKYEDDPVCANFHWTSWAGWAEPARWLSELGLRGDNNRIHWRYPPLNPTNRLGFAFGTSFPLHYYDDAEHGNGRIDFVSLPITAYEVGYDEGNLEPSQLTRALAFAARWNLTMNMFYHPVRLTEEAPRAAVAEALNEIDGMGITPLHMGNDELCLWWHARDSTVIERIERSQEGIGTRVRTGWPNGCIIRMLAPPEPFELEADGAELRHVVREQCGTRWLCIALPQGSSKVRINFGDSG